MASAKKLTLADSKWTAGKQLNGASHQLMT
jgi:hypothetical protein